MCMYVLLHHVHVTCVIHVYGEIHVHVHVDTCRYNDVPMGARESVPAALWPNQKQQCLGSA